MEMILDNVDKHMIDKGKEAAKEGLDGMSVRAGRKRGVVHISRSQSPPPITAEAGLGTQIEDFLDSSQGRSWNFSQEDNTRLVLPVNESEATRTPTLTSTPVQKKVQFKAWLDTNLGANASGGKRLCSPQRSTPLGSQLCSFERSVCSASPDSQATQLYADGDLSVVASPVGLSSTEERIEDEEFSFSRNLGENGEEHIDTHSEYIDGEWREVYKEYVVNGVVVKTRGKTWTSEVLGDTRTSGEPGEDLDKVLKDQEKKDLDEVLKRLEKSPCSSSEEAGSGCDEALSLTSDYPAEQGTQRSGSTPFTAWWSEESEKTGETTEAQSPPTPTQARSSPRAESEGSSQAKSAATSEARAHLPMLKSPPRCKRCKDRCEKDEGNLYKMSKVRADFFDAKDELIYTTHTS